MKTIYTCIVCNLTQFSFSCSVASMNIWSRFDASKTVWLVHILQLHDICSCTSLEDIDVFNQTGTIFSGYTLLWRDFLLGDWAFEEVFHIFESSKILPIRVRDPLMLLLYKYRFRNKSSVFIVHCYYYTSYIFY